MILLGIETSCDETAAAVVRDDKTILSHCLLSQEKAHAPYGGVVPEVAAREHIKAIIPLIRQAMKEAKVGFEDLSAVAATAGPGLIGGVIVGLMTAKGIAVAADKPLIAVNHLEGHALSVRLAADIPFPYLLLLVSGGHCQILVAKAVGHYHRLGGTKDDALGEAFDKVAKMLGLGFPGGPKVEQLAKEGNPARFNFPKPLLGKPGCDFSFSGLKTAVRRQIEVLGALTDQDKADICASFQKAVGEVVCDRIDHALEETKLRYPAAKTLVIAGGVAANQYLHGKLQKRADAYGFKCYAPPLALCTDNAAMIAWAGIERLKLGLIDPLDASPKARWPLAEL